MKQRQVDAQRPRIDRSSALASLALWFSLLFSLLPRPLAAATAPLEVLHEGLRPPSPPVEAADGGYWGVSHGGVAPDHGSIYRLDGEGVLTMVHSFHGSDGSAPLASLTPSLDGQLYGTTWLGGDHDKGTVFRIGLDGVFEALHSFQGPDGERPVGRLVLADDGSFYGTTSRGGECSDCGTIFKIDAQGEFATIHTFRGSDGAQPLAGLTLGEDGSLYGTTSAGGACERCGTLFKLGAEGLTTLHSFQERGIRPVAELTRGEGGSFYGTTANSARGWGRGYGTIFRLDADGAVTTLHSFAAAEGLFPEATLVAGANGSLFGATEHGGTGNSGTIFRFDPEGTLTVLTSIVGSPCLDPRVRLGTGRDGSILVSVLHLGALFRLNPEGGGSRLVGDGNSDGIRDISDAVFFLGYLFLGSPWRLPCGSGLPTDGANLELLDFNRDQRIDLSDPVALLSFLFIGSTPPHSSVGCQTIPGCAEACAG